MKRETGRRLFAVILAAVMILSCMTVTVLAEGTSEEYSVAAEKTFSIDKEGKIEAKGVKEGDSLQVKADTKTSVKISKVDPESGKKLEGARLRLLDSKDNVIEKWVSEKEAHRIKGLKTGEKYTLRELVPKKEQKDDADADSAGSKKDEAPADDADDVKTEAPAEDAGDQKAEAPADDADDVKTEAPAEDAGDQKAEAPAEDAGDQKAEAPAEDAGDQKAEAAGETPAAAETETEEELQPVSDLNAGPEFSISVAKVDAKTGEEVEGATLQILDEEGQTVNEWISTKKVVQVDGLESGVTYTLHEAVPPEGYDIAADTTFILAENGKITTTGTMTAEGVLVVEDTKIPPEPPVFSVTIIKADAETGEELEGAHLQLFKGEDMLVDWDTEKGGYEIKGLESGVEYTLRENVAPDGYTLAYDTTFTIDEAGKVTSTGTVTEDSVLLVEDEKTKVKVSKTDIADGSELEGATIQVLDKDGKVVEEWTSEKEAHEIEGLKTGVEYTLRETVAPDGYTIAGDTTFTIDETGKITSTGTVTEDGVLLVEDEKTKVKVSKTDIADGSELAGATIRILDPDDKVVEEWTSTTEAHEIEGLKTGVQYTLRETAAPDGYTVADDTTFTIDETGKITSTGTVTEEGVLLVEDTKTETPPEPPEVPVKITKVDADTGEALAGAHLQVLDGKGTIIEEWDSTKSIREVKGLKPGVEYTLRETAAPEGYDTAIDTRFTVDEAGKITTTGPLTEDGVLVVKDRKTEPTPTPTPEPPVYSVKVSKIDAADGKKLEGATIQVLKDGKVVEEWVSTKEAHEIKGLEIDVKYTLHEKTAPKGYNTAKDTTFSIDAGGKITTNGYISKDGTLLVRDKKQDTSKTSDSKPLQAVRTGDDTNITLWLVLGLASAAMLAVLVRKRRNAD